MDDEDSEGKQYAHGQNITHHEDNWRSWQQELLWKEKVSWGLCFAFTAANESVQGKVNI